MAYTARTLITRSYYLSQIVSRGLQTVSGEQIIDGLDLLNALLAVKSMDTRLIPYWSRSSFVTVAGTESYFVSNLVAIETLTFNLQDVRFGMNQQGRIQYFGQSRINNLQSLPFTYHTEREKGGTRIYLYFVPDSVYTVELTGKFGLTDVTLDTDLLLVYDAYYIEYLRYALGEYICSDYAVNFPAQAEAKFQQIQKKLMDVDPPDLSIQTIDYFGDNTSINWAIVNLSKGYLPS